MIKNVDVVLNLTKKSKNRYWNGFLHQVNCTPIASDQAAHCISGDWIPGRKGVCGNHVPKVLQKELFYGLPLASNIAANGLASKTTLIDLILPFWM